MRPIKLTILFILRALGLFALARYLNRYKLPILCYHCVSIDDEHRTFPRLFITQETFRRRMAYLARHYRVVRLDQGLANLTAPKPQPRLAVVTFDDGFYNFAARARPVLEAFNLPATIYMTTHYVDKPLPVYNLLLRYITLRAPSPSNGQVTECIPNILAGAPLATDADRARICQRAAQYIQDADLSSEAAHDYLRDLACALHFDLEPVLEARLFHLLTWDELKQLAAAGYDIEAHTHRHRNVVDNADQVAQELTTNIQKLAAALSRPVRHFAYPSGRYAPDSPDRLRAIPNIQLASAATCDIGLNTPATDPFKLRRFVDGQAVHQLEFEFVLCGLRDLLLPTKSTQPATTGQPDNSPAPLPRNRPAMHPRQASRHADHDSSGAPSSTNPAS